MANLFTSVTELLEACKAIPADTLAEFRTVFADSFSRKLIGMNDPSDGNAALLRKLRKEASMGQHDAAIRVMLATGVPLDFFLRTVRGGGQSFNVYGISKTLLLSRMMLSNSPIWGTSSDARTLRGTIAALLAGKHLGDKKGVASYLDDYMSALTTRGNYRSGGTQSSSSAHALAAMGLLIVPAPGSYTIPSGHAREALAALMGQEGATPASFAPAEDENEYLPY